MWFLAYLGAGVVSEGFELGVQREVLEVVQRVR